MRPVDDRSVVPRRRADTLRVPTVATAFLACAAAGALVLAPALFGDRSTLSFALGDPRMDVVPWVSQARPADTLINPVTPDVDLYVLPGLMRVRQLREAGAPARWDPAQLLGYPLAGNLPYPLFSPLLEAGVRAGLGPVTLLDLWLWLHLSLGAALAVLAARAMGLGPAAAAFAAVGFVGSGWMSTRWHLPHVLYATSWWPGLLLALEAWRRERRLLALGGGGLALGLSLLSGFPQVTLAFVGGLGVYVLWQRRLGDLLALGGFVVLALLVSAPQQEALAQAYEGSLRASETTRRATGAQGLAAPVLARVLMPRFFGHPVDFSRPDPPAPTMEAWLPHRALLSDDPQDNPVENAVYPGLLVLLVLAAGARAPGAGRARALLAVALLALGGCLVWPWLVGLWPPLALVGAGNVKRALVLWAVTLPFAAAFGVQRYVDGRAGLSRGALVLVLAGLVGLVVAGAVLDDPQAGAFAADLRGQAARQTLVVLLGAGALVLATRWAWAPAIVLGVDLLTLAWAFNPMPEQVAPFPSTPALERLAERPGRFVPFGPPSLLPAPAASLHGLHSVLGVAPMVPRRTAELLGGLEGPLFDPRDPRVPRPLERPETLTHPLLDLLAVDTVVHQDPTLAARTGLPTLFEAPGERLGALARPGAGPRAFLATGARVEPDATARLAWLASRDAPHDATVLLERAPPRPLPERGPRGEVAIVAREPGRWTLDVQTSRAGVVVVVESWHADWSARVDGEPAEVRVVDHALLGVFVEPGAHRVVLAFDPGDGTASGLALTGWLLVGGLIVAGARRGRR